MKIIWHGTASVEFISDEKLLFDPFVPLKHSDVPVKISDFDGFSDIFITHGHFDHIVNLPEIYDRNKNIRIHCTKTPQKTLIKKGIPSENIIPLDFDECISQNGFEINTYHGRHAVLPKASMKLIMPMIKAKSRGNIPFIIKENRRCPENDETVLYEIKAEGKNVVLLGSLNLRDDVRYPENCDLLLLPYNGWDDNFLPAVKVVERLKPKRIILHHYDITFPPVTSFIDLSPIKEKYKELITDLKQNEVYEI